jgi:ribosomal protein S12 methylthiotransferase
MDERLRELGELQDGITAARRAALIGDVVEVLVDAPGVGRSHREAPEIDGIIRVPSSLAVGSFAKVRITGAAGPDLDAEAV